MCVRVLRCWKWCLIRVGILLVDLLVLENLLRDEKTADIADTAELQGSLALVVADFGISAVAEEDLNTLGRASPGSLVERCLAALVDDGGIGTTRDEELGSGGIARGTGPVESSAAKGIDLWREKNNNRKVKR